MNMPTMQEALKLFDEGMLQLAQSHPRYPLSILSTYRSHATLVAFCAEIIASKLPDLDCRQAYILGLLHDYGKFIIIEENGKDFHGISGYQALLKMGYDDAARICLTHSFPNKDFEAREYNSYPKAEVIKVKKLLKNIEYNDYDRLIQLADLFTTGIGIINIKERMLFIQNKYQISPLAIKKKYRVALKLKAYFDNKCDCDIYKLLGVS